jgi:hypothetical protein
MNRMLILSLLLILSGCGSNGNTMPAQTGYTSAPGNGVTLSAPSSVFLVEGQSNAQGRGVTAELPLPEQQEIPNVMSWVYDHWETYKPADSFGPDLFFARQWAADHPGEYVGIVKCAVGATSMTEWSPGAWLYDLCLKVYRDAGSLPIRAVIWDQGESDANGHNGNVGMYAQLMVNMIHQLRKDTNQVMPFVFGETQFPDAEFIGMLQQAQYALSIQTVEPRVCEAMTDGLTQWADRLHFDTAGQIGLGTVLYQRYLSC